MRNIPRRQMFLGAAFAATLAATIYFWVDDSARAAAELVEPVEATNVVRPAPAQAAMPTATAVQPPRTRQLTEVAKDIFAVQHKEPEPQKAVPPPAVVTPPPPPVPVVTAPAPPPQPVAPPLPFGYIGKLGDEGQYTVFLSLRGRNYAVKAGDVVAQTYRVEDINPPTLTFMYLPMNIKQTMQIGEPN